MDPDTHIPFEYNEITDGIFVGTNQCCVIHFSEELLKKGVRANISLEKEQLDHPEGVDYHLWIPVIDHEPLTPEQFEVGVSALEKFVKLGIKTYVHCQMGQGRGPSLVAAYLVKSRGISTEEAFGLIRHQRPVISPNERQVKAVKDYEVSLGGEVR